MKEQQDTKASRESLKAVGELRKLRKNALDRRPPATFTGTCMNTTTCCITLDM